jgi:hypothetical protein
VEITKISRSIISKDEYIEDFISGFSMFDDALNQ